MKQKRKLRIFISNTFYPAKEPGEGGAQEEGSVASWELRVEGRLLGDDQNGPNKVSVDKHNVDWTRTAFTSAFFNFAVTKFR